MLMCTFLAAACGQGDVSRTATPCSQAVDCAAVSGCAVGACVCKPAGQCTKGRQCSLATELQDCGIGAICYSNTCIQVPTCINQTDCAPYAMYCSLTLGVCVRTLLCNNSSQCKAPTSFCSPNSKQCEVPSCHNGAVTCSAPNSVCAASGKCVPPATKPPPGGCTSDADCCPEDKDKNQTCAKAAVEHCKIPTGATAGTCIAGCKTNQACQKVGLKSCNSRGQCIKEGKHGDSCSNEKTDCRAGYYCCPILKRCFERCTKDGKCPDTGNKCIKVFINDLCVG